MTHNLRKGFPVMSMLASLYPFVAAVYAYRLGAPFIEALAYGLSTFGYVLLAFGVFPGRFRALRLDTRARTLAFGILLLIVGTVYTNIPPGGLGKLFVGLGVIWVWLIVVANIGGELVGLLNRGSTRYDRIP